jgi:hypothetical protein
MDTEMESLTFWDKNAASDLLQPLAQDLTRVPESEVFVEHAFSLCSFITAGRRCDMKKIARDACFHGTKQEHFTPHWFQEVTFLNRFVNFSIICIIALHRSFASTCQCQP